MALLICCDIMALLSVICKMLVIMALLSVICQMFDMALLSVIC